MDETDFRDAYAAPQADLSTPTPEAPPSTIPDLRLLAEWERRRLIYNGVLAVITLGITGLDSGRPLLDPNFWELLLLGAFGANVCFCTGPVAEAYARWIGVKGPAIGWLLFGIGLLLSIPLTAGVISGYLLAMAGW